MSSVAASDRVLAIAVGALLLLEHHGRRRALPMPEDVGSLAVDGDYVLVLMWPRVSVVDARLGRVVFGTAAPHAYLARQGRLLLAGGAQLRFDGARLVAAAGEPVAPDAPVVFRDVLYWAQGEGAVVCRDLRPVRNEARAFLEGLKCLAHITVEISVALIDA